MKDFITVLAIILIASVFAAFISDANAAIITMEFDSVPIQQPGGAITGCLVQAENASIIIVGDCRDVAADQLNGIAPTDTPDFIVDGHAWARL